MVARYESQKTHEPDKIYFFDPYPTNSHTQVMASSTPTRRHIVGLPCGLPVSNRCCDNKAHSLRKKTLLSLQRVIPVSCAA